MSFQFFSVVCDVVVVVSEQQGIDSLAGVYDHNHQRPLTAILTLGRRSSYL
jgi:hypothetical protein